MTAQRDRLKGQILGLEERVHAAEQVLPLNSLSHSLSYFSLFFLSLALSLALSRSLCVCVCVCVCVCEAQFLSVCRFPKPAERGQNSSIGSASISLQSCGLCRAMREVAQLLGWLAAAVAAVTIAPA